MKIKRILADIDFSEFFESYFVPEVPVVIQGITDSWPAKNKWTSEYIAQKLQHDNIEVNKLWFQTDSHYSNEDVIIPELVLRVLDDSISYKREKNFRLWINYKNHLTPFHSDTNGLYVFNVQVKGRKHWQIVAPDAPLKLYSFTQFPYLTYNSQLPESVKELCYEFDLNEGEMLFLPPYWYHKVIAMEDENINVNWVGTKRSEKDNRLFVREKEMMKILLILSKYKKINEAIDYIVGSKEKNYLENYAGNAGMGYLKKITQPVSYTKSAWRMVRELAALPYLLRDIGKIKEYSENPLDQIKKHQE